MRLATLLHFLVTLPFPRYHCANHHTRRIEERHGALWMVCDLCGPKAAKPMGLYVGAEEIRARKVT